MAAAKGNKNPTVCGTINVELNLDCSEYSGEQNLMSIGISEDGYLLFGLVKVGKIKGITQESNRVDIDVDLYDGHSSRVTVFLDWEQVEL